MAARALVQLGQCYEKLGSTEAESAYRRVLREYADQDDPVLQARRERAGKAAFRTIDLPRAATLLAQGAGRLIRTATDRGVVAVFDKRLLTTTISVYWSETWCSNIKI